MSKKDHTLQKVARVVGKICYLLAVVCGIMLYFKVQELGSDHPISASFLASMFFFVFVGFLLGIVGNADIPDLKIRPAEKSAQADDEND